MQVTALALLYLVHSQSWPLMREFVLQGGLHQLVLHLLHPNLYLRSQVIEVITTITSAPVSAASWGTSFPSFLACLLAAFLPSVFSWCACELVGDGV